MGEKKGMPAGQSCKDGAILESGSLLIFAAVAAAGLMVVLVIKQRKSLSNHEGMAGCLHPDQLPLGIAVFTPGGNIVWFNNSFYFLTGGQVTTAKKIQEVLPGLELRRIKEKKEFSSVLRLHNKIIYIKTAIITRKNYSHYLLLCEDMTPQINTLRKRGESRPVIALLKMDNLSEALRTMAEEDKPHLLGALERVLAEWAGSIEGCLRRLSDTRYIVFFTEWGYKQLERTRFAILDKVRELEPGAAALPLTVSVGIGINEDNISELGKLAQQALEVAQERGGDQVVIKSPEKARFFGGKSIGLDKRNKVKAKATAEVLKELIMHSSQVVVTGHEMADYDSMGAALGLAKAVCGLGKNCWVVLDRDNPTIEQLLAALFKEGLPAARFIKAEEAARKITKNTLLIVVDTHKPSLLAEPGLLELAGKVAVIDHHRRGEEFIDNAQLVYLQAYASSASELVTEMLQYLGEQAEPGKAEATALLAGITVDTKNFMMQTGERTFEAASYLRSLGADPVLVQNLLRDDISTIVKKAAVMSGARILYGKIALGVSPDKSRDAQPLAAKTADAMLNIAEVKASFVLWPYEGGVAVSARSNGEINVQSIMEKMGGGGHFTIAAAQIQTSPEEAEKILLQLLEEEFRQ